MWATVAAILGEPASAAAADGNPWLDDAAPWHEPADRRIDFTHMQLHVAPDLAAGTLQGTVTYALQRHADAPPLQLDAVNLQVAEASFLESGKPVAASFRASAGKLFVDWPAGNARHHVLRLRWSCKPQQGFYFVQPDADEPNRPPHAWTQGETEEVRHWLPAPDDPDERMTWQVTVAAPKGLVALSNGNLKGRTENGAIAESTFDAPWPLPLYLLTVAVGPFVAVEHAKGKVPVTTWALPDQADDVRRAFARLPQMVDVLGQRLGVPYPFASYGQVVVREFNFGGMENASLTTLTYRNVPTAQSEKDWNADGLLAHELGHQWFGDLVTCRTWADIWLNEGWASFADALWQESYYGADRYMEELAGNRAGYFGEAHRYLRPIVSDRANDPDELFDGHTYSKGAWVAHMLRRRLGEEAFWRGLKAYLTEHRFGSVETADLQKAMETASGRSLRGFFRRWVHQAGHPQVRAEVQWNDADKLLRVTLEQTQKVERGMPLFDLEIEVAVRGELGGDAAMHVLRLDRQRESWTLPMARKPALVELDPRSAWLIDWTVQAPADDLAAMASHSKHADVRLRALGDLGRLLHEGPAFSAVLAAAQKDPARHVRARAAEILGRGLREHVAAELAKILSSDADAMVRQAAARGLGACLATDAWPALLQAAERDPSFEVQAAALQALGKLDRSKARPILMAALSRPSFHDLLQSAALRALAEAANDADWPAIAEAVTAGRSKFLRENACEAVAAFGARSAARQQDARLALEGLLQERSFRIRRSAAEALGALDDARAKPALMAAAAREPMGRAGARYREIAGSLGKNEPLQERLKRLEDDLQQLRQSGGRNGH